MNGIITSKIFPNFSFNTLDSGISPHKGHQMTLGMELAGLGGTVRSVRPIVQYKQFIPVQNRRNAIGFNVQGSFISGYGGLVAPPFQRFFMGGENDHSRIRYPLGLAGGVPAQLERDHADQSGRNSGSQEPGESAAGELDGSDPGGPDRVSGRRSQCVRTNLEYRITIAGPVAIAPFVDTGIDPIIRPSQLQIATVQYDQVIGTLVRLSDARCRLQLPGRTRLESDAFEESAGSAVRRTGGLRMSTGLELQMFLPVVNAPFRIYWAYNPLRLDQIRPTRRFRLRAACSRREQRATIHIIWQ